VDQLLDNERGYIIKVEDKNSLQKIEIHLEKDAKYILYLVPK